MQITGLNALDEESRAQSLNIFLVPETSSVSDALQVLNQPASQPTHGHDGG